LDDGVPGVPPGITGVEGVAATHTKTKSSLFIINISTSTYVYCISMKYIMVDESFSFFPPSSSSSSSSSYPLLALFSDMLINPNVLIPDSDSIIKKKYALLKSKEMELE
jgi:hypothetical protein